MPQHAQRPRICHHCDGFATAAITTGTRHQDGTRATLRVTCPGCKGTGQTISTANLTRVGR